MVAHALGDVLPFAVGIAISPMPVVAVILMLSTPRALPNSVAFVVGWLGGLAAIVTAGLVLGSSAGGSDPGPSSLSSWLQLVLGIALVVLAVTMLVRRPEGGDARALPKWMQSIDSFDSKKSLGFGALSSAGNPKNLPLALAAASAVADADLPGAKSVLVAVLFVVFASLSVLGPVVLCAVDREGAQRPLATMKDFMASHNRAIMAVLLLVFGAKLLGTGLPGLLD